jgi:hypothetical protein
MKKHASPQGDAKSQSNEYATSNINRKKFCEKKDSEIHSNVRKKERSDIVPILQHWHFVPVVDDVGSCDVRWVIKKGWICGEGQRDSRYKEGEKKCHYCLMD